MPYYETVFIARQDLTTQQVDELTKKSISIIESLGGKIHKTESWGLRPLAYRIRKNRKGHYVLIEVDAPPPAVLELERTLRLNEDVLRYMSVRLETLSDKPSAIIRNDSNTDQEEAA